MALIEDKDRAEIKKIFQALEEPVKIINFTQEFECMYCKETHQLLDELTSLSDKLSLVVHHFNRDEEQRKSYGIDKIPATIIEGERNYGIRYFGIPSGYEFASLLDDIVMVSRRDSGLEDASRKKLAALEKPIHVQVFVTPT